MTARPLQEFSSRRISSSTRCALCNTRCLRFEVNEKKRSIPYERCPSCGYIRLSKVTRLSAKAEKERYLLHRNDDASSGYREYLERFCANAILPFANPSYPALDFGSGPSNSPALPNILKAEGFSCDIYDPFFARTRIWRTKKYGLIILHEVVEHLKKPKQTLEMLRERLMPNGILALRTRFLPDDLDGFASWWYRMDPTHISFYRRDGLAALLGSLGLDTMLLEGEDFLVATSHYPGEHERDNMERYLVP